MCRKIPIVPKMNCLFLLLIDRRDDLLIDFDRARCEAQLSDWLKTKVETGGAWLATPDRGSKQFTRLIHSHDLTPTNHLQAKRFGDFNDFGSEKWNEKEIIFINDRRSRSFTSSSRPLPTL